MKEITITFLGDILLTSALYDKFIKNGYLITKDVIDYVNDSDIITANFELPIVSELNINEGHVFTRSRFRVKREYLQIISNINWTFFSIANNHISDWGAESIKLTQDELEKISRVKPIGAGENIYEAITPLIIEKKGIKVAFISFCEKKISNATINKPGSAPFNKELIADVIDRIKADVNHIIVTVHWGTEYIPFPSPSQKEIARFLLSKNVNIIVGTHPHILQGMMKDDKSLVVFSLGNFLSDPLIDNKPNEEAFLLSHYSFILKVRLNEEKIVHIDKRFIEIDVNNLNVMFCSKERSEFLERWYLDISKKINTNYWYYSNLFDVLGKRETKAILIDNKNFLILIKKLVYYFKPKYFSLVFLWLYYKFVYHFFMKLIKVEGSKSE